MKFIKQILSLTILGLIFLLPTGVHAFDINNPNNNGSICSGASNAYCSDTANGGQNDIYGPTGLISDAINIISWIAGIAAVIVLMIGGFRFVVSGGDSNSVSGARSMILYALVGLVIIGAAQIIMRYIIGTL
jgi:hypothetical protein